MKEKDMAVIERVSGYLNGIRLLDTTFTTAYGERKSHILLTKTPKEIRVPEEEYQLKSYELVDFLESVRKLCGLASSLVDSEKEEN